MLLQRLFRGLAFSGAVAAGAMACDKVPLTAPAGTVITLVSSTNVLPINGTTEVIAVLIENGTTGTGTGATGSSGTPVHNGTLVSFTTSLGRIEPAEARTSNGRVSVQLKADGRSGTATITAFSGSASETLEVKIGAAAAERVTVTASPTSVPANGGSTSISARVEDASGNPLSGIPVTFTTTAGTLSAQSVLSNENGFATTTLTTNAAATVTASSGGRTATAAVTVRSRSTIAVTASANSAVVGAPVSFTVTPGAGVAMRDVVIDFGDGETWDLGAISSATAVVHYFDDDGIFQVNVRGEDVDGGVAVASTSVAVTPFSFSVTVSPSTREPVDSIFTFTVTDLPTGVPIDRIVWSFGDGLGSVETTSRTITRSYQSPGLKTITVTVHPLYGDAKSATLQVQVTPLF